MNSKNRKTLHAIFSKPTSASIAFGDTESLLTALGADVIEGRGSRVSFTKDKLVLNLHRPHPEKEAKRYQVEDVREFLQKLGVQQ